MRTFLIKTANDIWFSFQTENLEPKHDFKDIEVYAEMVDMFVSMMSTINPPMSEVDLSYLYNEADYIISSIVNECFETSFIPEGARPIETLLAEFPI